MTVSTVMPRLRALCCRAQSVWRHCVVRPQSNLVAAAVARHTWADEQLDVHRFMQCCEEELRALQTSGGCSQRLTYLRRVVDAGRAHSTAEHTCDELQQLVQGECSELAELARDELAQQQSEVERLALQLMVSAVPPDEMDTCDAVCLEVAAAAGGQEAMLFAGELFNMYQCYAARRSWQFNVVQLDESPLGGLSFGRAELLGERAYGRLKYESGVHRVQRVPATERGGRLHTSTASVALLPQPDPIVVNLTAADVNVEYFCATGKGGMNVNKNPEAVRVRHPASGLVVECQQERKARFNLSIAMRRLASLLYQMQQKRQQRDIDARRRLQVGTGDRSERIRTYNVQQDRVTDHRIKHSWGRLADVLAGGNTLDTIIEHMLAVDLADRFRDLVGDANGD